MMEQRLQDEVQELFVVEYDTDGSIEFYNWREPLEIWYREIKLKVQRQRS